MAIMSLAPIPLMLNDNSSKNKEVVPSIWMSLWFEVFKQCKFEYEKGE
jgi:hypothetical protein